MKQRKTPGHHGDAPPAVSMKCTAALPAAVVPPTAVSEQLGAHAMHAALRKPLLTAQPAACTPWKESCLSTLHNEFAGLQDILREVYYILTCTSHGGTQ